MKRYIYLIILVAFISCKKEEVMFFQEKDAISIYITTSTETDSLNYSFAYKLPDIKIDTLYLKVRIQGAPAAYDRAVDLQNLSGSNADEGIDYDFLTTVIPAGEIETEFPLVLYRNASLKEEKKTLIISVKENEHFKLPAYGREMNNSTSIQHFTIHVNDYISKPDYWDMLEYYGMGEFSVTKFQFMMNVYNTTDFNVPYYGGTFPNTEFYNMPARLRLALAEYEAIHGPLIDEFNNRLTF